MNEQPEKTDERLEYIVFNAYIKIVTKRSNYRTATKQAILKYSAPLQTKVEELQKENETLRQQVEELKKDKERLDYMSGPYLGCDFYIELSSEESNVRVFIDSAIAAQQGRKGV